MSKKKAVRPQAPKKTQAPAEKNAAKAQAASPQPAPAQRKWNPIFRKDIRQGLDNDKIVSRHLAEFRKDAVKKHGDKADEKWCVQRIKSKLTWLRKGGGQTAAQPKNENRAST